MFSSPVTEGTGGMRPTDDVTEETCSDDLAVDRDVLLFSKPAIKDRLVIFQLESYSQIWMH